MCELNRLRIFADADGSPQVRCFAVSQRLTSALCTGERIYYLKDYEAVESGKEQVPVSADVCNVIGYLVRLNGIVKVTLKTYEFVIEIARAFDWEDVQENVLRIITEHLYDGLSVAVEDRTAS